MSHGGYAESDEVVMVDDGGAAGASIEGGGCDESDGGVEESGVGRDVGGAGARLGGRGGDESDEDRESVDFVGGNFGGESDNVGKDVGGGAGGRVEARGGGDLEFGEVGFVVEKARGGDGAVVAGEVGDRETGDGGVEDDGVKKRPKESKEAMPLF